MLNVFTFGLLGKQKDADTRRSSIGGADPAMVGVA